MQKTTFFKRAMSLFLAFVMALGLLPVSEFGIPAYAAEGSSGPPATVTLGDRQFYDGYNSQNLTPSWTVPRFFEFQGDGNTAPGFCADHKKDLNASDVWSNPVSIEGTEYAVAAPLIAWYNYGWSLTKEYDQKMPYATPEEKDAAIRADTNNQWDYWTRNEMVMFSSIPQAAVWLIGNGKVNDLDDSAQVRMIAEERNATVKAMDPSWTPDSVEMVMGWITDYKAAYEANAYGDWDMYLYQPSDGSLQPIITSVTGGDGGGWEPLEGWIKLKKTDLSGNNLAGATFTVYQDSACQTPAGSFTTTADEWTYFDVSNYMLENTETFWLKETSTPVGYVGSTNPYQVTVSATNNATQDTAAAVNGGAAIKNGEPQPPEGVVNKVDQDGNGIGPATFHFVSLTNGVETDIACDENGVLELQWTDPTADNYLEPGEYTVTELIPPEGYEKSDEVQNLRLWIEDMGGVPTAMNSGPITFVNKPKHSVIIQKVDESGNGLPGAVFDIYFDGVKVDSQTTGADGTFTYAGTDGNGLQTGTWGFEEVKAPDGYLIPYAKYQEVFVDAANDDVRVHQISFINYTYPEIQIKKVVAGSDEPLAGAVFEVMIDGQNLGTFGPTGPDGTIAISQNIYGQFLNNENQDSWTVSVREVQAPDGYLLDDTGWKTAEISRGTELAPFVFTNTRYPDIEILKIDANTREPLAGATFEVMIDGGNAFEVGPTGADGKVAISHDEYGQFLQDDTKQSWTISVREIGAPEGYLLDDSGWHTEELALGQDVVSFVFENPEYPEIRIRKVAAGTGQPLAGAVFEVEIDGQNLGTFGPTDDTGEIVIDYATYAQFLSNGKESWTVSVREVRAPDGYLLDDPNWQTQEIRKGQALGGFVFSDTRYPDIEILKIDANTRLPLAGATFEVMINGGNAFEVGPTGEDGKVVITYEEYGQFLEDTGVEEWTVSVREIGAPEGYLVNDTGWHTEQLRRGQDLISFVFENTEYPEIRIRKVSAGTDEPLAGSVFEVQIDGQSLGTFGPTDETGEIIIDYETYERFLSDNKDSWTVSVREVEAPDGYLLDDPTWQTQEIRKGQALGDFVFKNTKYPDIEILKIDANSRIPLAGATFEVMIDGQHTFEVGPTGEDGKVVITHEQYGEFLTDTGVEEWTISVREIGAPEGYLLNDTGWHTEEVHRGQELVTFVFENVEYPDIVIRKVSAGDNEPLAGAVFEVQIDGVAMGTFGPTDETGEIIIDYETYEKFLTDPGKDSWTIAVREIEAPSGYLIDDPDWQIQELRKGQSLADFVFTDTKYPEIVIRKSDRETEERLPGTTFEIAIDAGASFTLTKQTDENGEIWIRYEDYAEFIGEIIWDRGWTVTVTETIMPEFYNKDRQEESGDWTITKQLLPGQSLLEFDFTDTHYRDLLIRKYDSTNSWLLQGAQFRLESISLDDPSVGSTISRNGTTDENGELLFQNLPNGTYRLTEVTPPTGYDLPDPHEWEIVVTSYSDRVIEFDVQNEPREGLTITKHDATTGKPLAGVEFSIRYLGDGNETTDTSNNARTYTTDANGVIHLSDVVPGWYEIRETRVPDGYVIDSEPRLVEIVNNHDTVTVSFHNYQDTQLIILKKDSQTGEPLPGARFTITTAGGSVINANLVTGANGYATMNGLEPGSYVVREVEAPDGHLIDTTPQFFEIREGQTEPVFLIFGNDGETTLYIRKEDAQTRLPVAGAIFELRRANGEIVAPRLETGLDGLASIDGLEPGEYIVEEIEAPPGYVLSENPEQVVNLESGETETVIFRNNKPGGIAILKQDAISGLPLEGAVFEVTRLGGAMVGRYTTGRDGYIRIPDLEEGYYYVQEVEAPEGYLLDDTRHQVYVENFKVTLLELDNYEHASFVVEKVDAESGIPLAGAEFALYGMDGAQIGGTFVTDQSGQATLNGIEPGWYILKELSAPAGYVLNEEEFRVQIIEGQPTTLTVPNTPASGITVRKVDATTQDPLPGAEFELRTYDGTLLDNYTTDASGSFVTVSVEPGIYYLVETKAPDGYTIVEERTEVEVREGENPIVTIENHKNTSIQIQKVDSITGAYLEGAEFEVRELNSNRVVAVCTTDRAGIAVTEPLPVGDYIVVETKAPNGYVLDETHHHVEVQYDNPAILRVSNVPLTGIMITKLSTVDDEPLMGAKFTIRTAEGRELGEVTTDTTGTATFPVAEPGVYWVQEVEQPDGYLLDDTVHRVEVVAGEMAPLVVENAPEASLVIFKGDADTGRGVAGAVFEVEHADGAFIGRYTTDAQGEALIRPIEPGHYIVREVSAPDGYELPAVTEKTITVLAGRINRVVFEDLAYGSLIVRLEDGADGTPLPNGRFQLIWAATGEMIQEGVTGNDGTIHWGNLPTGDYIIRQTYAPDGYTMIETEIRETVVSNETRTVIFQNVTAGIVIEKLDRTTSEPLAGARFQVTRNDDNIVIGEYVTDVDGLAMVSGLTPGMYTVEEIVAPEGYELDSASQIVHVKASEFAHATFTDTPFAGITINTVDQSNNPIAGVVIEIHRQNGELINTWTTDNTGIIQTDRLTSGYYVVKVIQSPDGYTPVTTETTVQIKDGVNANVRLVFNAGGTLNIYALGGDEVGLAGMQVEVTTINGTFIGAYTTDATGIVQVPGLDGGWYVVTVIKAPDGYTVTEENKSQNVEITSAGTAQVKFYFGQTYGVQIRTSVEQTGAMVPGVEYKITRLDGSIIGTYTSDDMGLVYVSLEPGWYIIEQTKLPAGYENYELCAKRNVEVLADQYTIVDFVLTQLSSMRVKVVDGSTEAPIYGVKLILRDSAGTIIDEYTTNNEGYITLRNTLVDGTYTLTMTYVPDGYTVDTIPKTIEVLNGQTSEIVWKLYNQAGQIQVHLTSSAYNPTLDLPAGSNLAGAVFEVYDPFTYAVLATIETDAYGVAASPGLPIGRYIIREKTAAPYFGLSGKETEVYIKINNDVVRVEYQAAPLDLKITHTVTGNANAAAGSFSKYLFTAVNNDSSSRLDNFFFNITIPTDAIRGGTLFTGKWSSDVTYNISYKTNMQDYRVFATGLSSASSYQYDLSSLALDVQSGEYVTDVRFEFGTVPAGFKVTSSPVFYGYVMPTIPNSYIVIVRSEAGGQFSGVWKTESALCTTNVINNGGGSLPSTLPKTGY